jgi:hypothetical protein
LLGLGGGSARLVGVWWLGHSVTKAGLPFEGGRGSPPAPFDIVYFASTGEAVYGDRVYRESAETHVRTVKINISLGHCRSSKLTFGHLDHRASLCVRPNARLRGPNLLTAAMEAAKSGSVSRYALIKRPPRSAGLVCR